MKTTGNMMMPAFAAGNQSLGVSKLEYAAIHIAAGLAAAEDHKGHGGDYNGEYMLARTSVAIAKQVLEMCNEKEVAND